MQEVSGSIPLVSTNLTFRTAEMPFFVLYHWVYM